MRGMRIAALFVVAAVAIPICAGCSTGGRALQNDEGQMWQLPPGELTNGIYVKNGNAFNPPLKYGLTFTSAKDEYEPNRVVWIYDYRHLIPEVNQEKLLIEYSPNEYPATPVIMEHFVSQGYSFGALFEKDGTDLRFPRSSKICPRTSIAKAIQAQVKSADDTRITELNEDNQPFPLSSVHGSGYIMGLQQDGLYRIGFYEGTIARQFLARADTEIYLQDAAYTLTEREQTKNGYFVIPFKEEMPNGLYCINGAMLVYYTGGTRDTVATPEPEIEETFYEPEPTPIVDTIETSPAVKESDKPRITLMQEASQPAPAPMQPDGIRIEEVE